MSRALTLRVALLGLALALALMGGIKAWVELARPARDVASARDWSRVPVRDLEIQVMPFHGVMHVETTYRWVVDSVEHTGHRYAFVDPTRWLDDDAILALQSQQADDAWVDPADPTRAVLVRTLPSRAYAWSGAALLLLSATLATLALASRRSTLAARIVDGMPRIVASGSMMMLTAWLGLVAITREPFAALPALAALGIAVLVARGQRAALTLVAVLGIGSAALVILCAANPFMLMDVGVDRANDPWFPLGYVADTLAFAALGLAAALSSLLARRA